MEGILRKSIVFFVLFIIILGVGGWFSAGGLTTSITHSSSNTYRMVETGSLPTYTDITVEEALVLLTSTDNGLQTPVDVRTFQEWYSQRIDTPYPEDPRRHSDFSEQGIEEFKSLYEHKEVVLYCKSGGRSKSAVNALVAYEFDGTIYNMLGGIEAWMDAGFPIKQFNDPPDQPEMPSGSSVGVVGSNYTFSSRCVDADEDSVRYGWSWDGDTVVDEWTGFYRSSDVVTVNHSWNTAGAYEIFVKAEDNVGEQSGFSPGFDVLITNRPNAPGIDGETRGEPNQEYTYTFSLFDADNDNMFLYVDWGDNSVEDWNGPYVSGEEVSLVHVFSAEGTYEISAKTKDVYDAESEWGTLKVNMPKAGCRWMNHSWFLDFLFTHTDGVI